MIMFPQTIMLFAIIIMRVAYIACVEAVPRHLRTTRVTVAGWTGDVMYRPTQFWGESCWKLAAWKPEIGG